MLQTIPTEEKINNSALCLKTLFRRQSSWDTWECCCGAKAKQQLQTEDVLVTSAFIL